MPTAYTSLLGLALPVTGELSGTWGDTVNNSITSLLDTSVAGTTNVSTDADVTLTTTTGASNTARQAILLFSGARTALRTVTAPAQSKIYTVINATTGGFSVKLVGVGPTTGVTIVAGESAICAWNGSDFVKVSNTGGAASFTNVTVTGTTTLSGLTASTALALDASKNVVSVTNTGSGSNVLATSPTLVTPALGTPSSGVVTNLTGTASININGTVGATTASTGAFTTLSATGAITSTLATGTAPLVIASTTKVANLNVDSLDGADWASPAALGSTTPAAVSATTLTTSSTVTFNGGTANGVAYLNGSKVVTSGSALVFDGSNLGIATTSPVSTLDVRGNVYVQLNTNQTNSLAVQLTNQTVTSNNGCRLSFDAYNIGSSALGLPTDSASLAFYTGGVTTERARIDASGNLIVGGTAATNTSSGRGNITINGSSSAILSIGTGGTAKGYVYHSSSDMIINATTGTLALQANGNGALIDTSGNLGLGVTPSAWGSGYKAFEFGNDSAKTGALFSNGTNDTWVVSNTYFNGSTFIYKATGTATGYEQASGQHRFYSAASGTAGNAITFTQAMTLDASGNLGIGTSSPSTKLHVVGTGQFNALQIGTNNTDINQSTSNPIVFKVLGTEYMRLDSSGNLGLGVTPSAWATYTTLQIKNGSVSNYSPTQDMRISSNAYYNAGWKYIASAPACQYLLDGSNGGHQWFTAPSGTAGNAITFTQAMTLDASGNLLVGNTAGTGYRLNVKAAFASTLGGAYIEAGEFNKSILILNNTNAAVNVPLFQVQKSGTGVLTLDSSGNLGIGISTPSTKLEVAGSAQLNDSGTLYLNNSNNTNQYYWQNIGSSGANNATLILSRTNAGETLRVDASGDVFLGTTTNNFASRLIVFNDNSYTIESQRTTTANEGHMAFVNANGAVGSIFTNGSATTYNTSSDYRLKNITGPITTSGAYIDSLNPVEGTWKADGSTFVGLIAHEAQKASRTMVATGVKDGEQMQGMDYSSAEIIANLIAEIQSLRKRLADAGI